MRIAELHLDSTVPLDDNTLSNSYDLTRRRCYYKENSSLRIISSSYFDQCLLCEVTCQNQRSYIAVSYSSPSQSYNEFEDFLFNLDKFKNQFKGTVMQIEKTLINYRIRVSKLSRKFRIPAIYNFAVIFP